MDCAVDNLEAVFAYMDDSQVGSPDRQTHLIHYEHFFPGLATNSSPSIWKNVFLLFQLQNFWVTRFFWLRVRPLGPRTLLQFTLVPPLRISNKLRRFLSMVNFYCRFLPGCASVSSPLTDILKGSPKTLQWTAMAKEAFQGAKCLLTKVVPLQHPSSQAKLSLATDASDSHIGGVIQQKAGEH